MKAKPDRYDCLLLTNHFPLAHGFNCGPKAPTSTNANRFNGWALTHKVPEKQEEPATAGPSY